MTSQTILKTGSFPKTPARSCQAYSLDRFHSVSVADQMKFFSDNKWLVFQERVIIIQTFLRFRGDLIIGSLVIKNMISS